VREGIAEPRGRGLFQQEVAVNDVALVMFAIEKSTSPCLDVGNRVSQVVCDLEWNLPRGASPLVGALSHPELAT
jgi:hypothetical protein